MRNACFISHWFHSRWTVALLSAALLLSFPALAAHAAGPQDDLAALNQFAQQALNAARSGDMATARKAYEQFDRGWSDIEDGIKDVTRAGYEEIEDRMRGVSAILRKPAINANELTAALDALVAVNQQFITGGAGAFAATPGGASSGEVTMAGLLQLLADARTKAAAGDRAGALQAVLQARADWLEVEGQVKTRSADDYRKAEDALALAATALTQGAAGAPAILDDLTALLTPYLNPAHYGIFDAALILWREGMEALLVVAALLAFLRRAGEADKQRWVWIGSALGLAASIALALAMQLAFSSTVNASNREIIEGVVGLVAAAMLLYVSYWMHSKASLRAWNRYIGEKGTTALASGSMWGLAGIAFLAIFREGAETALFYMGIAASISLADLVIGLVVATIALAVLGALMIGAGMRLPIGPFMGAASVLVFFLCFKFVGTGIHALQIAGWLPASSELYLPSNGLLGLFPTWETTLPQLLLLAAAAAVLVAGRMRAPSPVSVSNPSVQ